MKTSAARKQRDQFGRGNQGERFQPITQLFPERRRSHPRTLARCARPATDRAELSLLLDELGDEAGPACLMRCAETRAGVGVKILVEEIMIAVARGIR